jgi:hypothetical protein
MYGRCFKHSRSYFKNVPQDYKSSGAGHTAGLAHIDILEHLDWEQVVQGQYMPPCIPCVENNIDNEMVSGGNPFMNDKTSTKVNKVQIEAIKENYEEGKLNQDKIGKAE